MNVASYIDHTILKPTTVLDDIRTLTNEAREYRFAAVCVPPLFVKASKEFLDGSTVNVATVIGFPFGYSVTKAKLCEVEAAIADHADELDIVINLSHLKSGHWKALEAEMTTLLEIARINATIVKVIIESGILTEDEIIGCCRLYGDFGVDFVKTSTGYAERGATLEAVQLMRKHLPSDVRIKASGGIKTYGDAKMYIEAGAARIGCSAGVAIMKQQTSLQ